MFILGQLDIPMNHKEVFRVNTSTPIYPYRKVSIKT